MKINHYESLRCLFASSSSSYSSRHRTRSRSQRYRGSDRTCTGRASGLFAAAHAADGQYGASRDGRVAVGAIEAVAASTFVANAEHLAAQRACATVVAAASRTYIDQLVVVVVVIIIIDVVVVVVVESQCERSRLVAAAASAGAHDVWLVEAERAVVGRQRRRQCATWSTTGACASIVDRSF